MCGKGAGDRRGLYIFLRTSVVTPRNHVDLGSDGIIWKSGVCREKSEISIFLESGLCSLV